MRNLMGILVFFALLAGCLPGARAQDSLSTRLRVKSELGFGERPEGNPGDDEGEIRAIGDRVVRENWIPLRVTLENLGTEKFEAVVDITVLDPGGRPLYRETSPAFLSQGARRIVRFTVPGEPWVGQIQIEVLDSSRRYVYSEELLAVRAIRPTDELVLLVTRENVVLNWLGRAKAPEGVPRRYVQTCTVADLPDSWTGLGGVPVIAFHDAEYSLLTSQQVEALRQWVETGGHLVVSAGAGTQALEGSPLMDILPVKIGGVFSTRLNWDRYDPYRFGEAPPVPEEEYVKSSVGTRATAIADFLDYEGQRLFPHLEPPLVVSRSTGLGRATAVAFSFVDPTLDIWPATSWLADVLFAPLDTQEEMKRLLVKNEKDLDWEMSMILQREAAFRVPSRETIGLLFATYLFLAVPLFYLLLRRFLRPAAAWLSLPIMAVGYSIFVYASVYQQTGGRLLSSGLAILETRAGSESALGSAVHSIFSPDRETYTFTLERADIGIAPISTSGGGQFLGKLEEPVLTEEAGNRLIQREFAHKSYGFFRSQAIADLGGPVTGSLTLVQRPNAAGEREWRVVGTIWNGTDYDLYNINFVGCRHWEDGLGTLAPGQNLQVDVPWPEDLRDETVGVVSGRPQVGSGRPESVIGEKLLRLVRERETHQQSVCILAETSGVPWELELGGETLEPFAASVLVVHWPLELEDDLHAFARRTADISFGPLFGWAGKMYGSIQYQQEHFLRNRHQAALWLSPPTPADDWALADLMEEGSVMDRYRNRIDEIREGRGAQAQVGAIMGMAASTSPGVDKVYPYMVFDHRLQDWVQMKMGRPLPMTARDPFRERVLVRPWAKHSWSGKPADTIGEDPGHVPFWPRNRVELVVQRKPL